MNAYASRFGNAYASRFNKISPCAAILALPTIYRRHHASK